MLELKNITKIYPAGGDNVQALKGISLQFRKSEFVSILGPSGCGKTTMLNIIGGLDRYTDGDLVINGRSTKDYKDRDWDAYRNHSVGFVFQTYNLIPHQTVLQNVELALTLSGVGKKERRQRAKEALIRVGLGDQLKKKPNEMSGGQMQRVAIARAIVNNPDIILADEPTGALDSETSLQVMEILKEIASDRLVVMVTHNPDLAERYSTRIVRMLDGRITSDSAPLSAEEDAAERSALKQEDAKAKVKKPSMSLATSFGLSLKNLFTKKGRTTLTSFAGSIGIIGIALIYSVSQGTTMYIDLVQEQTLSSYPITIEAQSLDMGSFITAFIGEAESIGRHEKDAVYQKAMLYQMTNAINSMETRENDLKAFKAFVEAQQTDSESALGKALSSVSYGYDLNLNIYTKDTSGAILRSDTTELMMNAMKKYVGMDFSAMMSSGNSLLSSYSDSMSSGFSLWKDLLPGEKGEAVNDVLKDQYELLAGRWPAAYDEIILFVDERNELSDLALYAMGLKTEEEISELMTAGMEGKTISYTQKSWSYEDILNMDFRTVLPSDGYVLAGDVYMDLRDSDASLTVLYEKALPLKVVGIGRPGEDAVGVQEYGSIGYTSLLTKYIIESAEDADVVKAQLADPATDVLTGLPFKDAEELSAEAKGEAFRAHADSLSDEEKAALYVKIMSIPSEEMVEQTVAQTIAAYDRASMLAMMAQVLSQQMGMSEEMASGYISSMSDEDLTALFTQAVREQFLAQYAAQVEAKMAALPDAQKLLGLDMALKTADTDTLADYYDKLMEFSESSYEDNLIKLGCLDLDSPATINLYATSFADKDVIEEAITAYNEGVDEMQKIKYVDYVGLMMSSITTIINAITYVLIAFVAVSLIVSSIMIGVITLISVQERTKEIGILRAIGASKKNVSSMFNAETVIIGFTSGVLGVLITYLLIIPINMILHKLTNLNNLSAYLPPAVAVILVVISMLLTLVAGVIPSRSAAKKDPVVALRTE